MIETSGTTKTSSPTRTSWPSRIASVSGSRIVILLPDARRFESTWIVPPSDVHVPADHIHSDSAPRDVAYLLGGRQPRLEDQLQRTLVI